VIKQRNQLTLTNENRQQVKKNREMLPTVADLQQQKVGWCLMALSQQKGSIVPCKK